MCRTHNSFDYLPEMKQTSSDSCPSDFIVASASLNPAFSGTSTLGLPSSPSSQTIDPSSIPFPMPVTLLPVHLLGPIDFRLQNMEVMAMNTFFYEIRG
jgi:hypothetical protein